MARFAIWNKSISFLGLICNDFAGLMPLPAFVHTIGVVYQYQEGIKLRQPKRKKSKLASRHLMGGLKIPSWQIGIMSLHLDVPVYMYKQLSVLAQQYSIDGCIDTSHSEECTQRRTAPWLSCHMYFAPTVSKVSKNKQLRRYFSLRRVSTTKDSPHG